MLALRAVLALLLLSASGMACATTLAGVVVVVIDGDTVLFRPDHDSPSSRAFLKVRLADIDAPEKDQPYGDAATRALRALLLDQQVGISTVATDVYGRTIARIQLGALPVNAELVRRGFAWAYDSTRASARSGSESFRASTGYRRNSQLKDAQRAASRARRGLWQDAAPTPPWLWRRTHATSAGGGSAAD